VRVSLHRYWLEFAASEAPVGMALGCGVTAFDLDDAMRLLRQAIDTQPPVPARVIEDVDVSTLDHGHVLPNMRPSSERGVWFPTIAPYR
jgi:hypothetical protein